MQPAQEKSGASAPDVVVIALVWASYKPVTNSPYKTTRIKGRLNVA